jgi:predicted nucleic acid binding AN1-type Zn finger protein
LYGNQSWIMAEFPDLGQHCALPSCSKLDYTPYSCRMCNATFCTEHRFSHGCPSVSASDIPLERLAENEIKKQFLCSLSGCFTYEYVKFHCEKCGMNYCVKHRQCEEHSCKGLTSAPSRKIDVSRSNLVPQSASIKTGSTQKVLDPAQRQRADRIAMMKAKTKNKSNIPPNQQLFLFVNMDCGKREAILCSNTWSVGKCLDVIAAEFSIENNNGRIDAKKIRLFAADRAEPLPMGDNILEHVKDMSDVKVIRDL